MSAQQLHLFDPARPLLQRFGAEFFRAVPRRPGIYIMGGESERVLYIGQSKNLRHRLGSYKNARPDRAPRKIIRLVHSVRTIVWQVCESAEAARLKENQLLRLHRPKFNVQNVYPQAYRFITLQTDAAHLTFHIGTEPPAAGKTFGAFKGGATRAYAALLRLLWAVAHQPASPHDFPAPLLNDKPPREYRLPIKRLHPTSRNFCGHEEQKKKVSGALALTPALSPGERENHLPPADDAAHLGCPKWPCASGKTAEIATAMQPSQDDRAACSLSPGERAGVRASVPQSDQFLTPKVDVPWIETLENFLAGESDDLIRRLTQNLPAAESISPFQHHLQTSDLALLTAFFEHGPKRNRRLRTQHEIATPIITQEELDDLLVTAKKGSEDSPERMR